MKHLRSILGLAKSPPKLGCLQRPQVVVQAFSSKKNVWARIPEPEGLNADENTLNPKPRGYLKRIKTS